MQPVMVGDIQAPQDPEFQEKEWRVQRVAWGIMFLVVLAAALGAFGHGPLAHAQVSAPDDSFELKYNRVARHRAPEELEITVNRPPTDTIGLSFDAQYIGSINVEDIIPEPIETATGNQRVTYYFAVQPGAHITFQYEPDKIGRRRSAVTIENGASVRISQFVFP